MEFLESICALLRSLLSAGVIYLAAFGLGRPVARLLRAGDDDPLADCVWSLATGLGLAGSLFLLLGRFGVLHPAAVAAVTLAGGLWALWECACVYLAASGPRLVDLRQATRAPEIVCAARPGTNLILALAFVTLLASFTAALAPPTSSRALCQSLDVAKNVLLENSLHATWYRPERPPGLVDMWCLWALALDGPVAANLIQWGLGALVALATVLVARPMFGGPVALVAGAEVVLCPSVQERMIAPLDGLALAAPLACSLAAFDSLAVAVGWQSRHEFLLARVPTYRAASLVSRISRPDERLLCQDPRTFYFSCLAKSDDSASSPATAVAPASSGNALVAAARASGYTYLLMSSHDGQAHGGPRPITTSSQHEPLAPASDENSSPGEVIPILEYRFADDNHRYTRYILLRLR